MGELVSTGGSAVGATGVSTTISKALDDSGRRWRVDIFVPTGSGASEAEIDTILSTMRGSLHSQT